MTLAALVTAIIALVSALISIFFSHKLDRVFLKFRLNAEYSYEQKKKLRELIGGYVGQMIEASESWNHRMWNLYQNESNGWLNVGGNYTSLDQGLVTRYYFKSMTHRFITLFAIVRSFEKQSLLIDSTIADPKDLYFVKFLKAFFWSMTNGALFKGMDYDNEFETDHFFSDNLRAISDEMMEDREPISFGTFCKMLPTSHILTPILAYFDGLSSREDRLRWDRLVTLHLLVMAFLNSFGYDMQQSTDQQFREVASNIKNVQIKNNLKVWVEKLGLRNQEEVHRIVKALNLEAVNVKAPQI